MSYYHLTTFERSRIEILHKQGYSCRQIAKIIGRHHSTVARELDRNSHNNSHDVNLLMNSIYNVVKTLFTKVNLAFS